MFYSVYLGLWSITFLNWWTRRENELRFLWGNEQHQATAAQAEPRHQFKGVLEINPDTGRQMLVARSEFGQSLKRLIGFFAVFFMMIVTISAATMAMLLRYVGDCDVGAEAACQEAAERNAADGLVGALRQKKYDILSASTNLFVIISFGIVFEMVATKLNNFENYRTDEEYSNGLVLKNFLFQFVNNYFSLFYIAFMREIPDPFSKKPHPCAGGSCLAELQIQLIVVFSAKTVGPQIANTLKPFLFKAGQSLLDTFLIRKARRLAEAGMGFVPISSTLSLMDRVAMTTMRWTGVDEMLTTVTGAAEGLAKQAGLHEGDDYDSSSSESDTDSSDVEDDVVANETFVR